ncbi:uncharacterized protein LOC123258655 isoform X2 [Cotesia glomerata]|uniref:Uncharacterized protein n=1 Tax=Cotesia glomerata TaxID=32391 RepID=A0AAV7J6I3_COTGL|nr:uncharacterized protein LOC123258655 isoform X2 [Cotesia glomerata]KAH0568395.1 hypothetical protein KQX54_020694 [Cotesia glomerata]
MALQPSIGSVPPGAIQVDRNEAAAYQYRQIKEWPHFRDVWPFKVGVPLLAGLAACSALVINRHFRIKVKLRNQGVIATQITSATGAVIFATAPHIAFVMQDLFLNTTPCPLCVETRATFIQTGAAIIYPSIAAPLANFFLASRIGTYRLPYFADGKEIFKLWIKFMKPLHIKLVILTAVNILAAGFITYKEAMSIQRVRIKLIKFAEQLHKEESVKLQKLKQ